MDRHRTSSGLSDIDLLARCPGDSGAMAELIARHGPYVFGVVRPLVGDSHEAEDVVQETFAALLRGKFRAEASVRTFLVGIAVRQAANSRRKRRRWFIGKAPVEPTTASSESTVDAKSDVTILLATLPAELKEVIVLRELEQMSYEQIAKTLEIPRGTVESRLHRARNLLRERWGGTK